MEEINVCVENPAYKNSDGDAVVVRYGYQDTMPARYDYLGNTRIISLKVDKKTGVINVVAEKMLGLLNKAGKAVYIQIPENFDERLLLKAMEDIEILDLFRLAIIGDEKAPMILKESLGEKLIIND